MGSGWSHSLLETIYELTRESLQKMQQLLLQRQNRRHKYGDTWTQRQTDRVMTNVRGMIVGLKSYHELIEMILSWTRAALRERERGREGRRVGGEGGRERGKEGGRERRRERGRNREGGRKEEREEERGQDSSNMSST